MSSLLLHMAELPLALAGMKAAGKGQLLTSLNGAKSWLSSLCQPETIPFAVGKTRVLYFCLPPLYLGG